MGIYSSNHNCCARHRIILTKENFVYIYASMHNCLTEIMGTVIGVRGINSYHKIIIYINLGF